MTTLSARARGALLGLAIGDALGAQHEFDPRGAKVDGFEGGGPWNLKPGQWTDDTSMALCLAISLLAKGGPDAYDQMDRYIQWYTTGYMSSTGKCFDIGGTTRRSLDRYIESSNPWQGRDDPQSQANGCIMRIAPVPIWYHDASTSVIRRECRLSARTTHGGILCDQATELFGLMLHAALNAESKAAILKIGSGISWCEEVAQLSAGFYLQKPSERINGTGYVIDCLEAALWCFATTDTFDAAIKLAIHLGDDTDTTAAVCGQLAGAYYGVDEIRADWLVGVHQGPEIAKIADALAYHAAWL